MDISSAGWWLSLLAILLIDLVLAGEHARAMQAAVRGLPPRQQALALIAGATGAVLMRTLMTIGVLWLLQTPGLKLVGGLALLWIAWRTLIGDCAADTGTAPSQPGLWRAMCAVAVADALTGIDNVLAVAAAANNSAELVVIGLLLSIPMVIFGSAHIPRWLARHPQLRTLGAGVMALTAARMMADEPWQLQEILATSPLWYWGFVLALTTLVLALGWRRRQRLPAASRTTG